MVKPTKIHPYARHIAPPDGKPFKLDLGCGERKQEGHFGIDIVATQATDFTLDLTKTPWPIDADCVDGIFCSHFLEHIDGPGRIPFMEECYRILKVGAQMAVIVPYWSSMRSIQDPTHKWPPVCENSFLYFNRGWREANKLEHYGIRCDFDFTYGYQLDGEVALRSSDYQQFAMKHYLQAANDLHVTLTRRE